MDKADVESLARFLAKDFPFNVRAQKKACGVCFSTKKSTPEITKTVKIRISSDTSKVNADDKDGLRKRFEMWMKLFEDGGLDPIQFANVYIPSRGHHVPKFNRPPLVLSELGEPCIDNPDCMPVCLLCYRDPTILPEKMTIIPPWTFPVHESCCVPCGHESPGAAKGVYCKTLVLSVPKLFEESLGIRIRCPEHRADKSRPSGAAKAGPSPSSAAAAVPAAVKAPLSAERPTPALSQCKPPKQRRLLPIERKPETGSLHIGKMLFPAAYIQPPKKDKPSTKRSAPDEPPARGPGAAFFYGAKSFDFSEPKRLPVASDDLAHQEDQDEAGACAGDGKGRAP